MTTRETRKAVLLITARLFSAAVILLAVGEPAVRRFDLIDRLNAYPRRLYIPSAHPDLAYRLRPRFHTARLGHTPSVRINPHGLRGAEIDDQPVEGVHRVLVLGDSVVYGHGLPEASSFPVRLGSALAEKCKQPTEVLNGAASGWNTLAEAAFLEKYGLALQPSTVVLGVSLNDFGPTPTLTSRGVLTSRASQSSVCPVPPGS